MSKDSWWSTRFLTQRACCKLWTWEQGLKTMSYVCDLICNSDYDLSPLVLQTALKDAPSKCLRARWFYKNCCHLLNYRRITRGETWLSPNNTKWSAFSKYFKICGFVFNCAVTVLAHELWVITCDYHLPTWSHAHLWCLQEQTLSGWDLSHSAEF